MWLGRIANCTELFSYRRTSAGFCCAFNYVRSNGSVAYVAPAPLHVVRHGPGFGLTLLFDQQLDDYVFTLYSNQGVRILVFDPENFPDERSGAVKQKIVIDGEEMLLSVVPQPNRGLDEMRKYQPQDRNCVFGDEVALTFAKK